MLSLRPLRNVFIPLILLALGVAIVAYLVPLQRLSGEVIQGGSQSSQVAQIQQTQQLVEVGSCTDSASALFIPFQYKSYAPAVAKVEACVQKASDECAKQTALFQGGPFTFLRLMPDGKTPLAAGTSPVYWWKWVKLSGSMYETSTVTAFWQCVGAPAAKIDNPPKTTLGIADKCADWNTTTKCAENVASWKAYGTCAKGLSCALGGNPPTCYCYKDSVPPPPNPPAPVSSSAPAQSPPATTSSNPSVP